MLDSKVTAGAGAFGTACLTASKCAATPLADPPARASANSHQNESTEEVLRRVLAPGKRRRIGKLRSPPPEPCGKTDSPLPTGSTVGHLDRIRESHWPGWKLLSGLAGKTRLIQRDHGVPGIEIAGDVKGFYAFGGGISLHAVHLCQGLLDARHTFATTKMHTG